MEPTIQKGKYHLHETTKSNSYVVQAWFLKKFLSAVLDLHKWDFRMLVAVVNGKEDKFLDSHGFGTLYEGNFSFPIYLKGKGNSIRQIWIKDWWELWLEA